MINKSELRIGNIYMRKHGKGHTDTVIDESLMAEIFGDNPCFALDDFENIPLTEEWLMKFGFEISENEGDIIYYQLIPQDERRGYGVSIDHEDLAFYSYNGNMITTMMYDAPHFQFIHQLQNLYFTLTGVELTLPDKQSIN